MFELKSNFYPASEPKNGYIGRADLAIADSIRINDISVFKKEDGYNIQFAEFGEGRSYVVPDSKDAYAAMMGAIEKAINADNHFAVVSGKKALRMKDYQDKKKELVVKGHSVNEKYVDARYSLEIVGLCTLYGVTSKYVQDTEKKRGFIGVDMPVSRDADGKVRMYTDKEGKEKASLVFQGITHKTQDADGKEVAMDYADKIRDAVRAEHNSLRKKSLDGQVAEADAQKDSAAKDNSAKQKEQEEPAR